MKNIKCKKCIERKSKGQDNIQLELRAWLDKLPPWLKNNTTLEPYFLNCWLEARMALLNTIDEYTEQQTKKLR
jgi:hypothetical protein